MRTPRRRARRRRHARLPPASGSAHPRSRAGLRTGAGPWAWARWSRHPSSSPSPSDRPVSALPTSGRACSRTSASASRPSSPLRDGIVWELRMPRVLTAAAVGAGLALCGVVMQALTRNPLADPYLLGLSSGASVGAVVVLVLGRRTAAARRGLRRRARRARRDARARGRGRPLTPTRTVLAGLAVVGGVRRRSRASSSSGARPATPTARSSPG